MGERDPIPGKRLFVPDDLAEGRLVAPTEGQAHYLLSVLRLQSGDEIALFNGRDGEWRAALDMVSRKHCRLVVGTQLRPQANEPDLWLVFAPIKRAAIDFVAEKATEIGVSALKPVVTRRTIVERVNLDRLSAHCIEAAEQCERLTVPTVDPPIALEKLLDHWPAERMIIFCDERRAARPIVDLAQSLPKGCPLALLIGPEGGFTEEESAAIRAVSAAHPVHLGPRLLRADTAALAALSVLQACAGDWLSP